MSLSVIICHIRSYHVSLDFSDKLSIKSGGRGGRVKYVLLRKANKSTKVGKKRTKIAKTSQKVPTMVRSK
jgi:hypothetical protein